MVRFIEPAEISAALEKQIKTTGMKLYSIKQIEQLPKPVLISRFLHDAGYAM